MVLAETKVNTPKRLLPASDKIIFKPRSPRQRITAKQRAQVVERYVAGLSANAVSKELGISKPSVLRILNDAKVSTRSQGGAIGRADPPQ